MIRALIEQTFDSTKKYLVLFGLSTDSKPVSGLITGSEFHEVDTGVKYEFDEVNSQWHEVGITEQEIKDEIDAWLDDHPEATTTVQDGSISYAKLDASLKAKADTVDELETEMDNKANIDGSYSSLTAGNAEQLVSTVGIEDKVPYNFRTSGGSADIGDRETDMVVGGTVAWNQMVKNGDFTTNTGWATNNGSFSVQNNVATVTPGEGTYTNLAQNITTPALIENHKYLYSFDIKSDAWASSGNKFIFIIGGLWVRYGSEDIPTGTWNTFSGIYNSTVTNNLFATVRKYKDNNSTDFSVRNVTVFDLTVMFGSTIAEYIYSLETGTAGAGVAWFRKLFPKPYYAYDAGSLQSVNTSAHNMTGFNAYNNTTGKAKLVGGMQYQITGTYSALSYSTGETLTPDADGYFKPTENGELTITGGNATDTCVHLVWDGEKDGQFEPYELNSYALDSSLTLRGIPKLDSDNKLYYDGDTYESDGTVTRKYGIVDLGTLTWSTANAYGKSYSNIIADIRKGSTSSYGGHIISPLFIGKEIPSMAGLNDSEMSVDNGGRLQICKTAWAGYTNAQLQSELSNVMLVYELATSTTETANPYQNPQIVNDFGTEEYVDAGVTAATPTRDVAIPVGHQTFYQANLRAKLEMAPDSPSGDGDYIVRQTDGENTYVPLAIPTELPTNPSENGTYSLKVTVADGVATMSWVADS